MSGKQCAGIVSGAVSKRESKAYAEGRAAAAGGALIGTNPHPVNFFEHDAWDRGHASHTADPAGTSAPAGGYDCVAEEYGAGYTP